MRRHVTQSAGTRLGVICILALATVSLAPAARAQDAPAPTPNIRSDGPSLRFDFPGIRIGRTGPA